MTKIAQTMAIASDDHGDGDDDADKDKWQRNGYNFSHLKRKYQDINELIDF